MERCETTLGGICCNIKPDLYDHGKHVDRFGWSAISVQIIPMALSMRTKIMRNITFAQKACHGFETLLSSFS